eukprot:GHVR01122884.1.p1 GENE.GHVR01122884.1~~GHVR01122884.1.p1  ORF type:complete len:126 (+),score=19.63 GHVR01122884.1:114-491(+)
MPQRSLLRCSLAMDASSSNAFSRKRVTQGAKEGDKEAKEAKDVAKANTGVEQDEGATEANELSTKARSRWLQSILVKYKRERRPRLRSLPWGQAWALGSESAAPGYRSWPSRGVCTTGGGAESTF